MKFKRYWMVGSLILVSIFLLIACQSQELTSAKLYIQQQNWNKAEEFLLKAEKTEPQNPEVPFLLGDEIYARQGKWEKMNAAFDRSLAISDQYKTNIQNARMKYWTESFNSGAKKFNAAIDTTDAAKPQLLKTAIAKFEAAVTILPNKPETYNSLATAYLLTDSLDLAKQTFEKAIKVNPDNFQVYFNYGKLMANQGNQEEAIKLFTKAHNLKPDNTTVVQLLASLYVKTNQPQKALDMYDNAIQQEPDNGDLYFNEAMLYIQMAQKAEDNDQADSAKANYQEATKSLEKSLQYNTTDEEARIKLGELYQELEQWDKAEQIFRKVLKNDPKNVQVLRKLAVTVYRQGHTEEGEKLLEQAKQLEGKK